MTREKSQADSGPCLPAILATMGTKGSSVSSVACQAWENCLATHSSSSLPRLVGPSLGTRLHRLMLRFYRWKVLGSRAVRVVLSVWGQHPRIGRHVMCPTALLVEEEDIGWSAHRPVGFLSHILKKKVSTDNQRPFSFVINSSYFECHVVPIVLN